VRPDFGRDATAIVGDRNEKKLAVAARAEINATRPADGVNGVVNEVRQFCWTSRILCSIGRSLRHTAVSLLKDAGVPDAVVMALVGHESAAMSHRYTHVGKEALSSGREVAS
jgi:integrase